MGEWREEEWGQHPKLGMGRCGVVGSGVMGHKGKADEEFTQVVFGSRSIPTQSWHTLSPGGAHQLLAAHSGFVVHYGDRPPTALASSSMPKKKDSY